MKILLIKTSSLGDVIHTLPALTDAMQIMPGIEFHWVVEEAFTEVPAWHKAVTKVIPVALRRWRKKPWQAIKSGEWENFVKQLRAEKYDLIIDAQGLMKSAFLTLFAQGVRCGLDRRSAWESFASFIYQRKYTVQPEQHAVIRARQLLAQALNYSFVDTTPEYGVDINRLPAPQINENYVVFLHGTTWSTKHWPENYWQDLAKSVTAVGFSIQLLWGNQTEYERAQRIAATAPQIKLLPKLKLIEAASILAHAKAVVAVDTGLGHLAAALNVSTVSLYGPTNPKLTGTQGAQQIHLAAQFPCAPCLQKKCTYEGKRVVEPACFGMLTPKLVWVQLKKFLLNNNKIPSPLVGEG